MLPMWECCQCQCCQYPIGDWNWRGHGAGRIGLVYYSAKGKLTWRQNADIAVRRATGMDARTAQAGFTSTVTTRSTANGAVRQATGTDARIARIGFTGTALAATSASGADRPQTARAAPTPRRAAMRSNGRNSMNKTAREMRLWGS